MNSTSLLLARRALKPIHEDAWCACTPGDETEATVSETECSTSDELDRPQFDYEDPNTTSSCLYEEYTVDEFTIEEEFTVVEEYEVQDDNLTCDYTFVTLQEEEEEPEKHVWFWDKVRIHPVPRRSEYTIKEKGHLWISSKEKGKAEQRLSKTLAKMIENEDETIISSGTGLVISAGKHRGLENFTTQGSKDVAHQINRVVHSVMDEQDRQWLGNIENGESLMAAISRDISKQDELLAQRRAQCDEEEAVSIYSKGSFYKEYKNLFVDKDNVAFEDSLSLRVRTAKKAEKKKRKSVTSTGKTRDPEPSSKYYW